MKKISTLIALMLMMVVSSVLVAAKPVENLNLIGVDFSLEPQNESQLDYLPFEQLAEHYNISYSFDQKDNEINGRWNHTNFTLIIGSKVAEIKGKREILQNPVVKINGHIMVPIEFLEELLNIDFRWSPQKSNIIIKPISGFADSVKIYLYTNKTTYKFGEQVVITMILKNVTQNKVIIPLRTSQIYDVILYYDTREIWRWSKDKMFTAALTNLELEANESKVYSFTLPAELILTPAQYRVKGYLVSDPQISGDDYYFTITP